MGLTAIVVHDCAIMQRQKETSSAKIFPVLVLTILLLGVNPLFLLICGHPHSVAPSANQSRAGFTLHRHKMLQIIIFHVRLLSYVGARNLTSSCRILFKMTAVFIVSFVKKLP